MRRRLLTLFLTLSLLVQVFALGVAAEDTYWDDPTYWKEMQRGDQLYEEETITFDSFTTRALHENESLHKGVDVSSFQGNIDWEAVKADGVEFAFIKVGARAYGSSGRLIEDSMYAKNIKGALAVGIKVGVYIFSQAITEAEAIEEAEYLLERVSDYDISLPLIMDYEYAGNPGRLEQKNLSKAEATRICQAFCETVEAKGYQAAVYANMNFLNEQLNADQLESVWLAHYALKTDYTSDYDFWQCTSSGRVKGITGYVDLDFWFMEFPFRDVSLTHWAFDTIQYVYERGIVKGMEINQYAPEGKTTRGQVATMIYRMVDSPSVTEPSAFTDLTAEYYKDAVAWAQQNGIIKGRTETTFDPDAYVTRQELVTMMYRLAGEPATEGTLEAFEDANQVAEYAKAAMTWAVKKGIIKGETVTTLNPEGSTTRAQIAAILARYEQLGQ